ncbi:MAG: M15 family metallopeptidase [Saprospiraceae bacterium]
MKRRVEMKTTVRFWVSVFIFVCMMYSCKPDKETRAQKISDIKEETAKSTQADETPSPSVEKKEEPVILETKSEAIPEEWKEITEKSGMVLDIKYADDDNFTKKQIYDCGRCFLRPEAVSAISKVRKELQDSFGYNLKLFDCFRPQPYQQRLWDAVPNPDYVTPPAKGSMHSRGLAVDLTVIDDSGDELDMGTPYDHLGKEAHTDYKGHAPQVYKNREILRKAMEKYGFKGIRTEWWHYSYRGKSYPLDAWVWPCK